MSDLKFDEIPASSALENDIPFQELNRLAELESYNKHHYRPTNYQHKWWARRLPAGVFRCFRITLWSG